MKKGKLAKLLSIIFASIGLSACIPTKTEPSLWIDRLPNKLVYKVGEKFSLEGLSIVNKDTKEQVTGFLTSVSDGHYFEKNDIDEHKEVKVTKTGYKYTSFEIKVYEIKDMLIDSMPTKTSYKVGEAFSLAGLKIKDKETGVELKDYKTSVEEGHVFTSTGVVVVNITLKEYNSLSFNVNVSNLGSLQIEREPTKLKYNVGDKFSNDGLLVSDGTNLISDYSLSIQPGEVLKTEGIISVVVSKQNYDSANFSITVEDKGRDTPSGTKKLNIYYINDTHGAFKRNDTEYEAGMAYISSYLKYKKQTENCIILSGGDMFQGGPESNKTNGHIMIDAMNEIGFDAMVLGNHEFDWGEDVIAENSSLMNFPLLSCNTFYAGTENAPSWVQPYTIINRGGVKVGIVGFAQQNLGSSITGSISSQFSFPSPTDYVIDYATMLKTSYNCDIVLAAGHDGGISGSYSYEYEPWAENYEKTGRSIVDGVFFAHDHNKKSGTFGTNNIPYVESGCNGKNIAYMDFTLTADGVHDYYQVHFDSVGTFLAYANCTIEDETITALLEKYKEQIGDMDEVLCTFDRDYSKEEFAYIACKAMLWYVNNHRSYFDNAYVYLATHNTGGVRNDVYAGDFTLGDLYKCFPFDNPLCIQKCDQYQYNTLLNGGAKNQSYRTESPVYVGGVTTCVTISYIAEYSDSYQESYVKYDGYTAKTVLIEYLSQGLL